MRNDQAPRREMWPGLTWSWRALRHRAATDEEQILGDSLVVIRTSPLGVHVTRCSLDDLARSVARWTGPQRAVAARVLLAPFHGRLEALNDIVLALAPRA